MALLVVIGALAFRAFQGDGGGAGSPEAAVRNLADAISKEDAPSALTLLPPGEVRSMKAVVQSAAGKASKAGLLRAGNPFGGVDLKVTGLQLDVQKPAKDVAKVSVHGGSLSYTVEEKAAQAPLQSMLAEARENADDDGANWGKGQVELGPTEDHLALVLITVRQHGRWFVSPAYSLLERWRQANGLPAGNFGVDLSKVATGSDSPQGAVTDFTAAAQAFDASRLIDLLSPDELGGAARRYRQAIIVGTSDEISRTRRNVSFRVNDSSPVVRNKHGGSAEVAITSASGVSSSNGDSARWSLEGTCLSVISSGDRSNRCLAGFAPEAGLAGLADSTENLFISVTSYHGKWYVSPVQTALRYIQLLLDKVTDRQVLALFNARQFAKPDGTIAASGTVKGSLTDGQYGVYTYDVPGPGPILACPGATSGDNRVAAFVYRPNGRPAREVTDGVYVAEEGGAHRVVLRAFDAGRPAAFDVAVKPIPVQDVNLPGDASGNVGKTCDGRILRFNASAGDHVLIQGRLPDSRPSIFDSKGAFVSSGRIFNPSESGSFMIALTGAGDYAVHLERTTGTFLTQYRSMQGSVASRGTAEYQLYVSGGERFRIAETGSGGFDGRMELVNPAGTIVASADDTNGRDPAISYSFSSEGIYRVRISGYQGQAGSFTVAVS